MRRICGHRLLQANDVPTIKQYQEVAARHLLLRAPQLAPAFLLEPLADHAAKKCFSAANIAFNVAMAKEARTVGIVITHRLWDLASRRTHVV